MNHLPAALAAMFLCVPVLSAAEAGTPLALLAQARVQKELNLSADQVGTLKGLAADVKKGTTKAADALATLTKTLKADQVTRLEEISYQVRSGAALMDDKVATTLKLTKKQTASIADTWKTEEESLKGFLILARFRSAEAMQEYIAKHRRDAGKKLLDVLSEDQKKEFTKMQGKAFDTAGLDRE